MIVMDAEFGLVDQTVIALIKDMARDNPKHRSRICMSKESSPVQEMVIVLGAASYIRPHRHPRAKSESYHVMEGELKVRIFLPDGGIHREVVLNKKSPFYRMKGGWFHQPVPMSEWVVYHEVYEGPFNKEADVEYASWAAEEK